MRVVLSVSEIWGLEGGISKVFTKRSTGRSHRIGSSDLESAKEQLTKRNCFYLLFEQLENPTSALYRCRTIRALRYRLHTCRPRQSQRRPMKRNASTASIYSSLARVAHEDDPRSPVKWLMHASASRELALHDLITSQAFWLGRPPA